MVACNGDNVPDCFQNAGDLVREEVVLPSFSRITVFENIELILKTGAQQRVEVETGEFLRNEVRLEVTGDRLVLEDKNNCNLFRPYGTTKIYITSPNIEEIRSSTGFPIRSDGPLNFPSITLYSEGFLDPEAETTDGSFELELATEQLTAVVNGIAYLKLSGVTTNLDITIAAGDSRIEAENLSAQNVMLNHRGSNDILTNPQQRIEGTIRGTGDVLSFNRPETVLVEELFTGRLIFK
ncbi:MAG: head GIN domain-containing protein [Flavobacteriaceae bacterium]